MRGAREARAHEVDPLEGEEAVVGAGEGGELTFPESCEIYIFCPSSCYFH